MEAEAYPGGLACRRWAEDGRGRRIRIREWKDRAFACAAEAFWPERQEGMAAVERALGVEVSENLVREDWSCRAR